MDDEPYSKTINITPAMISKSYLHITHSRLDKLSFNGWLIATARLLGCIIINSIVPKLERHILRQGFPLETYLRIICVAQQAAFVLNIQEKNYYKE